MACWSDTPLGTPATRRWVTGFPNRYTSTLCWRDQQLDTLSRRRCLHRMSATTPHANYNLLFWWDILLGVPTTRCCLVRMYSSVHPLQEAVSIECCVDGVFSLLIEAPDTQDDVSTGWTTGCIHSKTTCWIIFLCPPQCFVTMHYSMYPRQGVLRKCITNYTDTGWRVRRMPCSKHPLKEDVRMHFYTMMSS